MSAPRGPLGGRRAPGFEALPPYPLADIPELRRRLEAAGVDVIDLGAGDADLPPPPAAVERLREAAGDPSFSRYPFQLGLPAFREAVADYFASRFDVAVDPFEEILPLLGSKEGIAKLPLAFVDRGDAAVVPDPGYQAYRGGVLLAGGEPHLVPLRPEHDFLIPFEAIPEEVAERTRVVYLNYPNNPTAATAPLEYFEGAVRWCARHGAVLVHDHAYSEVAFDGYRPPSILEVEGARDVAVEFHSFSKTFNMTGWRLGWAVGNPELLGALRRVKTFMDTGVFLAVQAAGVAALHTRDAWLPGNLATFRARRDAVVDGLREGGFEVRTPRATMYVWVPVPGEGSSEAFARRVLEEAGVVVLPGGALGAGGEGFFRIALTVPEARLREAVERLAGLADQE